MYTKECWFVDLDCCVVVFLCCCVVVVVLLCYAGLCVQLTRVVVWVLVPTSFAKRNVDGRM